jgi:hypothetical protein
MKVVAPILLSGNNCNGTQTSARLFLNFALAPNGSVIAVGIKKFFFFFFFFFDQLLYMPQTNTSTLYNFCNQSWYMEGPYNGGSMFLGAFTLISNIYIKVWGSTISNDTEL